MSDIFMACQEQVDHPSEQPALSRVVTASTTDKDFADRIITAGSDRGIRGRPRFTRHAASTESDRVRRASLRGVREPAIRAATATPTIYGSGPGDHLKNRPRIARATVSGADGRTATATLLSLSRGWRVESWSIATSCSKSSAAVCARTRPSTIRTESKTTTDQRTWNYGYGAIPPASGWQSNLRGRRRSFAATARTGNTGWVAK